MGSRFSKRKRKQDDADVSRVYCGAPIPDHVVIDPPGPPIRHIATVNTNLYKPPQSSVSTQHPYNLKELAEIIMFGFVRIHCLIALEKTPQDVIDLCLLFYTVGDEWDTATSDSRLVHDEGQIVLSKPQDSTDIMRYYAFGKDTCSRGQRYLWRFHVTARDIRYNRVSISIGIINRRIINQKSFDRAYNNDYLYDTNRYKLMLRNGNVSDGSETKPYCAPANVGDIIEMELDMTRPVYSKLSYVINNIPCGVAFDRIPTKLLGYAICVAFQRRDKLRIIPDYKKHRIL